MGTKVVIFLVGMGNSGNIFCITKSKTTLVAKFLDNFLATKVVFIKII